MTDPDDIESALRKGFIDALPDSVGKTAFENQPFDPKGKPRWFSFWYLPNDPTVATLGNVGQDRFDGICQIDLNIEPGKGKEGVAADILALRSLFTAGARLSYGSAVVTVKSCGRKGGGRLVGSFYRFTVSIAWESRISRN